MATALETGIDWGTKIDATVVTYHFAEQGGEYVGVAAYAWLPYETLQLERAFALFETFLDLTFAEVASGQHLTLVIGDNEDMEGFLGFFFPPGSPMPGSAPSTGRAPVGRSCRPASAPSSRAATASSPSSMSSATRSALPIPTTMAGPPPSSPASAPPSATTATST